MNVRRSYRTLEFVAWSRRWIILLVVLSLIPVLLHQVVGLHELAMPWPVVLLLGTTVALVTGFKNAQTYGRSVEAQQAWASILTGSRLWGVLSRELTKEAAQGLIHRHIAWLTCLRFELRSPRVWESLTQKANARYKRRYDIPEHRSSLGEELAKLMPPAQRDEVLAASNPAAHLLNQQSAELKSLLDGGTVTVQSYLEMLKVLRELYDQQSRCERIKNFPYPRQYAAVSALFVAIFCIALPFGMIGQFVPLDDQVEGFMKGHMVWLVVPFSVIVSWMYTSLDQVGESTANPFEGGANDVPISQMSRTIEIELRQLLGETDLPKPLEPKNGIAM